MSQHLPAIDHDFHHATFEIAPATPDMRDALLACHRDVRFGTDIRLTPAYAKATLQSGYYEDFWQHALESPDHITLVARQADRILGFIRLGPADNYGLEGSQGRLGELHQIYIASDMQGQGLGHVLYAAGMAALQARGYEGMLINALSENARAIGFYEHQGARRIGEVAEDKDRQGEVFHLTCAILRHDF